MFLLRRLGIQPKARIQLTVSHLLAKVDEEYQIQGRKSLAEMRYHAAHIRKVLGEHMASDLTRDHLRHYVQVRQREGAANATINREMAALRHGYNLAIVDGQLPTAPKFPMLREENVRQGTYTREEVDLLCSHLPAHVWPVVRFAYLTGRRRGEILQIRWEDVNLKEGWVCIRAQTTKTGEPDRIPLSSELYTLMEQLQNSRSRMASGSTEVFQYQARPFRTFYTAWRTALRKTGLKDKLFHDLRRTVATDLIEAGVSEKVAMAVTGHRTRSTFDRYNIIKSSVVRDAMAKLSLFRGEK